MDKRVKKLWIIALRSGEFKQCKGHLENDGSYCALGVLSVLALLEGICTYNVDGKNGKFDNRQFRLSYNIMKWAGIAQDDEKYLISDEQKILLIINKRRTSIVDLNDEGKTFIQLANIIERHL